MRILLGVTGGVAAKLTPKFIRMLLDRGHEVQVVATEKALYFFEHADSSLLVKKGMCQNHFSFVGDGISSVPLWTDKDEWFGDIYHKDQDIPHVALTKWANVFAIVPLTANTIGKMAHGIADNLLSSETLAWPCNKPLIIAPAMNTVMWLNFAVQRNLDEIKRIWYFTKIVPPVTKKLACGDVGEGALADLKDIVEAIEREKPC